MAPARMMQFIDKHVRECPVCQMDKDLPLEIEKIRDFILPESRAPKAIKAIQGSTPAEHRTVLPEPEEDEIDEEQEGQELDEELEEGDDEALGDLEEDDQEEE